MTKCLWHKCGKEFAPAHHLQRFCSDRCRASRQAWKQQRGSVLVDLLLANDTKALDRERLKLMKEIYGGS